MDKTLVVRNILTNEMVQAGKDITEALEASDLELAASFWFYLTEPDTWRLFIASPWVKTKGPRKTYTKIHTVL